MTVQINIGKVRPSMRRFCVVLLSFMLTVPAFAVTSVPAGNRNVEQPGVPGGSARRTAALKTTYENKYRKVMNLLRTDAALRSKIVQAARAYGIDPIHIAGAIVGEHTYNVDAYDRLQTYYVKAASYLGSSFAFKYDGQTVDKFVQRPEFAKCNARRDSYSLWTCREAVWNTRFAGKSVDGTRYPRDRFGATFFQPFYAGQSFGLGQLNPLTALQVSDLVHRTSGLPKLDASDPSRVYETIMDPDKTLPYVAATLKMSIDAYRRIAGFDISKNPGITATLYNVGTPEARASALKAENAARRSRGQTERLPEENYYGWLVNDRIDELKALF